MLKEVIKVHTLKIHAGANLIRENSSALWSVLMGRKQQSLHFYLHNNGECYVIY
ncbi:MAG TPA: hypothetical protein HA360_03010 [Nanoarchaeota archaeon]|nr:hypothetical protein [Candidatus Woesearchaeota archaeon]HIH14852.1 hypothetical protein [Nanoarchaeota archaeon]HIH58889.1 hypothetical protein [Nanoarchaeota archaeon]HII14021.1 hypothetical protein [Nanoarchaeota archaeon]HIJ05255.1 hypothetical protein [Nanoarchaeota archaeon]